MVQGTGRGGGAHKETRDVNNKGRGAAGAGSGTLAGRRTWGPRTSISDRVPKNAKLYWFRMGASCRLFACTHDSGSLLLPTEIRNFKQAAADGGLLGGGGG